jgi:hypothetical protein
MSECIYCKRHHDHGGKCQGTYKVTPCLLFERDPRGKWEYMLDTTLQVRFGSDIPQPFIDTNNYEICGIDKTLQIIKINKIEWNIDAKGLRGIIIYADIRYWSDENGVIADKPKLRLIKKG